MPLPTLGIGDGGSFAFGADGGPIRSQDQFDTNFRTGSFGTGGATNTVALVVAGAAIAGILVWAITSHSRR